MTKELDICGANFYHERMYQNEQKLKERLLFKMKGKCKWRKYHNITRGRKHPTKSIMKEHIKVKEKNYVNKITLLKVTMKISIG